MNGTHVKTFFTSQKQLKESTEMRDKNERRTKSNDAKKGKEKVRYHSYLKILVSSSYCFVWYFCNQSRTLFSPILQKERGAAAAQWFPKNLTRSVSRNGIKKQRGEDRCLLHRFSLLSVTSNTSQAQSESIHDTSQFV